MTKELIFLKLTPDERTRFRKFAGSLLSGLNFEHLCWFIPCSVVVSFLITSTFWSPSKAESIGFMTFSKFLPNFTWRSEECRSDTFMYNSHIKFTCKITHLTSSLRKFWNLLDHQHYPNSHQFRWNIFLFCSSEFWDSFPLEELV